MDDKIIDLSNTLERKARMEASCLPVDRYFLEPYLNQILSVNRNDFLLCNLERMSNTYTVQLLLCLPELWEDISVEDLIDITKKFTNKYSYYTLIEFTYRYIEINIIELILNLRSLSLKVKLEVLKDFVSSLYLNLLKTEGDYLFFDEGLYGVKIEDWIYTRQRLLADERVKPILSSLEGIKRYLDNLLTIFDNTG